jgi:hypothetical protein
MAEISKARLAAHVRDHFRRGARIVIGNPGEDAIKGRRARQART